MKPKNKQPEERETPPYDKKTYFYLSVGAAAASAVAFGLTFTLLQLYALVSALLLALAAVAFADTQKRKNNFRGVRYASAAAYVLLILYAAFFIGGLIWSAL